MTPTELIITAGVGALVGFGIGVWYALRYRDKKKTKEKKNDNKIIELSNKIIDVSVEAGFILSIAAIGIILAKITETTMTKPPEELIVGMIGIAILIAIIKVRRANSKH